MKIRLLILRAATILLVGIVATNCTETYHTALVESADGRPISYPSAHTDKLNVCTVGLVPLYELTDLLRARGHRIIPLQRETFAPQFDSDKEQSCDVVVILERSESPITSDESLHSTFDTVQLAFTFISLCLIPSHSTGYDRSVIQILKPATKHTERVLVQDTRHNWRGMTSYAVLYPIAASGQSGRARLEMNLRAVAAIESMGNNDKLPIDTE